MYSCKECGATWNSNINMDNCPFCGADLLSKKAVDSVEEAFSLIIEQYGQSVFLDGNRLLGLLSDYAPKLTQERRLVKTAIEAGAYKALYEASDSEKMQTATKYISILSDDYFVDRKWAKIVIMWCLGILAPELVKNSSKIPLIMGNSAKNGFTENPSNNESLLEHLPSEIETADTIIKELPEPYIETILKEAEAEEKVNYNLGFGAVQCRFEPLEERTIIFESDISDSEIPQLYVPVIEEGIRKAAKFGVVAGYPVTGVKVTLFGGAYHPCATTKEAFEIAAKKAFKNGISKAYPVLLEAIGVLKIELPDEIIARVIDDINNRRGCVLRIGYSEKNQKSIVEAEVPLGELKDYASTLISMADSHSKFDVKFKEYVRVTEDIAKRLKKRQ